jgi:hypothetical protein
MNLKGDDMEILSKVLDFTISMVGTVTVSALTVCGFVWLWLQFYIARCYKRGEIPRYTTVCGWLDETEPDRTQ